MKQSNNHEESMMSDGETSEDIFSTTSWPDICWLTMNGAKLLRTVRRSPRAVEFFFADKDACKKLAMNLMFEESDEAKIFSRSIKAVRQARTALRDTP